MIERFPLVEELPANQGYIVWINNEVKRETVSMPNFHHKQSTEDFRLDTGITWTVNSSKKPQEKSETSRAEKKKDTQRIKRIKDDIMKKVQIMRESEGKNWTQIKDELVLQEDDGIIPNMGYSNKTPVYFSNEYGKWKKN